MITRPFGRVLVCSFQSFEAFPDACCVLNAKHKVHAFLLSKSPIIESSVGNKNHNMFNTNNPKYLPENSKFKFHSYEEFCFIDDDSSFLFMNDTILKTTYPGISRNSFDTIQAALEYFTANPHKKRLVFLDLNIGLNTGFDFLDALLKTPASNADIIMLTTSNEPEHIQKAFAYPAVKAYIFKPLTIEIISQIAQVD